MSQIVARIGFSMGEVLNTIKYDSPVNLFLITSSGLFLTDGFSTLLIFVSYLYWFHTYQLKTQGYVILLMRYAIFDISWKLSLILHMLFGLAKLEIKVLAVFVNHLQVALVALTTNPSFDKDLLSTVKSWPSVIYSALPIISAIEPQLNTSSMTDALGEGGMNIVILILITNFGYYYIFSIMNYFTMSGTSRVVCNWWTVRESFCTIYWCKCSIWSLA